MSVENSEIESLSKNIEKMSLINLIKLSEYVVERKMSRSIIDLVFLHLEFSLKERRVLNELSRRN